MSGEAGDHGWIEVRGARTHNLQDITVKLPRGQFVVISGVSGSGKSSLAFDTLYAEGQRRYVESLSSYARQFIGQMKKADCDGIEGLSPAISIDQKQGSHNPRSTVATVTEIQDYLRLLWARIGIPHCPQCGREVAEGAPFRKSSTMCCGTWKGTPSPFGRRQFVPEKAHTSICIPPTRRARVPPRKGQRPRGRLRIAPGTRQEFPTRHRCSESTDSAAPETAVSA